MLYPVMLLRRTLLLSGLIFVCFARAEAQRLPSGVSPKHYALTIMPDLAKARFAGSETINVMLDAPTNTITLNAAEITFGPVTASVGTMPEPRRTAATETPSKAQSDASIGFDASAKHVCEQHAATVTLDAANEQATFTFAQPLPTGPVELHIAYTGILNDKLRGFYLSHTRLRSYGVTQFEATDARRAFPSFDEPALKATFNVSLVVDSRDTAISNTPILSDTPGPLAGKHTIAFAITPKMSTYLVAWLVGDFRCTQGRQDGITIRACATPDKVAMTKFALQAAKWDLHYYNKYFGIKYPLAKLDLIAIPDFDAGAMENFGCITFRETEMLIDKKNDDLDARKQIAETVAHELSHQWFGDLVTPAWWNNIWLNEGFATWMEAKASAQWKPDWGYPEDVAIDKEHTMDRDAGTTTRSIRSRAETPQEIDEMFDDIAYGKAGAVIGMVENWVGEEVFRKGVQAYLAAHAYGSATAEDFWNAETRASGLPVDAVMRSFVDQPGVPLVTLASSGERIQMAQRRFFLAAAPSSSTNTNQNWTIPLCFTGAPCRLLIPATANQESATMDLPQSNIHANAANKGYYRTDYAPPLLRQVERSAESALSVPERIGLVGDQWALVRAGQGTVGDFLNLVIALKQDPDATLMDLALNDVASIHAKIATEDDRQRLAAVIRREFAPVYAAMGQPKHETSDRAQLREVLFEALGRAQDPAVLAQADAMTKQLFAGQKLSDPELGDAAVSLASAKGDATMYDGLMKVIATATDPHLKEAAVNSLTRFESPGLVARTLDYAVSDAVRSQDSWMLIARLLQQRETQDQAWEFLQQHWPEITRKATASSSVRIIEAAGDFCTVQRRYQVASFFRSHATGASQRPLRTTLDRIDECIHLRATQEPALRSWLNTQSVTP
jgi:aminopeptidase N